MPCCSGETANAEDRKPHEREHARAFGPDDATRRPHLAARGATASSPMPAAGRSGRIRAVLVAPRSLTDLDPAWMTQALAPHFPGAAVSDVRLGEVADGTNRRASILLRYSSGSGPARVFVKLHGRPLSRVALLALGALTAEARLFSSGVGLGIEHAEPYGASYDARRLRSFMLLEDVTLRGGAPNDALAALSIERVRDGLRELARLHAAHWDRPLEPRLRFVRPWRLRRAWSAVSLASLMNGMRRLRSASEPPVSGTEHRRGAERRGGHVEAPRPLPQSLSISLLERQFRASATLAASGQQTLLHGDPHPGNTYSLPGERIGFYDWQLIRTGNWCHDVGYFLIASLTVESRREHERDLLDAYLDALREHGVSAPSRSDASERYRAAPAYGLGAWLHTLSAGSFQPRPVCLATIERFAAAYEDLGTATSTALASPASVG